MFCLFCFCFQASSERERTRRCDPVCSLFAPTIIHKFCVSVSDSRLGKIGLDLKFESVSTNLLSGKIYAVGLTETNSAQ